MTDLEEKEKQLFEVFSLIKKYKLEDDVWLMSNMSRISQKLVDLGLHKTVNDQRAIHPNLIRMAMQCAVDEYVRVVVERERGN